MPIHWTPEQVAALAPDVSSAKAGKELAAPRHWLSLGMDEQAAWGECQGSRKNPYQTQIDLREVEGGPAFRCSCPSRKFPCKHGLGLFLLLAAQPQAFTRSQPPDWVSDWLQVRAERRASAEKRAEAEKAASVEKGASDAAKTRARAEKTAARRQERVEEGVNNLRTWLHDLVRQGLATLPSKGEDFWEAQAKRLVDAQAPGLARRVRQAGAQAMAGEGWQSRVLEWAAGTYLFVDGFGRIDSLPDALQEDIRQGIGWTASQEALLAGPGVIDRWAVLGQHIYEDYTGPVGRSPTLRTQRTWLWGRETQRWALLLSFAAYGQALDASLSPGSEVEAEVVFYPGSYPLRGLVKQQLSPPERCTEMPGYPDFESAQRAYAAALAANPWIEIFPMAIAGARPVLSEEHGYLLDGSGRAWPLHSRFNHFWEMLAVSGGYPLGIFGEWQQDAFLPLSFLSGERWIHYPSL